MNKVRIFLHGMASKEQNAVKGVLIRKYAFLETIPCGYPKISVANFLRPRLFFSALLHVALNYAIELIYGQVTGDVNE